MGPIDSLALGWVSAGTAVVIGIALLIAVGVVNGIRRWLGSTEALHDGSMRWRSGLFRAWLVGSIAWVAYRAWDNDGILCLVRTEAAPWCDYRNAEYYAALAAKMIGWPFLVGIAILALTGR
jgi:hypothetical protein